MRCATEARMWYNRCHMLDKELYRNALEQYKQWNEAELGARARSPMLSPAEGWRRYVELVDFCLRLAPEQSRQQREQRLADWDSYHQRVRQLEAWRQSHGKAT